MFDRGSPSLVLLKSDFLAEFAGGAESQKTLQYFTINKAFGLPTHPANPTRINLF